MTRQETLEAAQRCVCSDRNAQYGEPEDSFATIATFWQAYLNATHGYRQAKIQIDASDVAAMMAMLKIARIANDPDKADSWIDLAGYAACGAECAGGNECTEGRRVI